MKSIFFVMAIFFGFGYLELCAQKPKALSFAHAHNDYEKLFRKDFVKAIEAGCSSVEIDVFPYRNKLKVAHVPLFLGIRTDFEKRYLKALDKFIKEEKNIYANPDDKLILMVDIKRNSEKAYLLLKELCKKYEHLLTVRFSDTAYVKEGPLQILLSGSKPYELLYKDSVRYMQLDGGLGDIASQKFGSELVPRVSTSYRGNFKWRGPGKISEKELEFLRETVRKAKSDGRQLRFWGMPNNLKVLNLMLKEGVYWLNIDRLGQLKKLDREAVRARGE
jgi:alkaline phosphatase